MLLIKVVCLLNLMVFILVVSVGVVSWFIIFWFFLFFWDFIVVFDFIRFGFFCGSLLMLFCVVVGWDVVFKGFGFC